MKKRGQKIIVGVFILIMMIILFIRIYVKSSTLMGTFEAFIPWLLATIGVYMGILYLIGKDKNRK